MALSDRDRFLIAVAKFLGSNPTEPHPLAGVLVCESWLLEEVVTEIIPKSGEFHLDLEHFNRLMLNCGRRLATAHFYDYFFKGVNALEAFEQAVEKYRIKAMWLFGSFEFGYKKIATIEHKLFDSLIRKTEPIGPDFYESRPTFGDIEQIPADDLELLGYISSGELKDLDISSGRNFRATKRCSRVSSAL